jgi:hypothetical protein
MRWGPKWAAFRPRSGVICSGAEATRLAALSIVGLVREGSRW